MNSLSLWSLHSREYLWFRLSGIPSCGARTLVSLWGAILSLWTEVGLINPWSQRRVWTQGLHYQDTAAPWSQVRSLLELSVKKACCFSWWDTRLELLLANSVTTQGQAAWEWSSHGGKPKPRDGETERPLPSFLFPWANNFHFLLGQFELCFC